MELKEILTPQRCFCRKHWPSKKRILKNISDLIAERSPVRAMGQTPVQASERTNALLAFRPTLGQTLGSTSRPTSRLDANEIYHGLTAREQLGSTGLGNGIAIPHCRVATCSGIIGSLLTLEEPVDYDAIDGKPVDLLFVLVVPQVRSDDHVRTLATLAELFKDKGFCNELRNSRDGETLFKVATST